MDRSWPRLRGARSSERSIPLHGLWIVSCILLFVPSIHAGNIFDDDWTAPPARSATLPPAIVPDTQPASDPTLAPANAPSPANAQDNSAGVAAPNRRAIPSKADQSKSRKLFKEVYAKQLADRSPAGRRDLATRLLDQAAKTDDSPTDEFVLLVGATEAGREAADLNACNKAADALGAAYEVDSLMLKSDLALKVATKGGSRANGLENARVSLDLIDQLIEAGDYITASRLASALLPAASADPNLGAQLRTLLKDSEDLRSSADRIAGDVEKLKTTPDDPSSNLAVGQFLCFKRGDWVRGLPMLAKGSDAKLRAAAASELARSNDPDAVERVADEWRAVAKGQVGLSRVRVGIHAADLYQMAIDSSTGLRREAMGIKLDDANTLAGRRIINLLALVNVPKDVFAGDWKIEHNQLVDAGGDGRLRIPYRPPEEYDYVIDFTRMHGSCVLIMLSAQHHNLKWVISHDGHSYGFDFIDGVWSDSNETHTDRPDIGDGVRHKCVIRVRRDSVSALMDGKLFAEFKRGYSHFTIDAQWFLGDDCLGVGSYQTAVTFHSIELVEITGKGKMFPRQK